MITHPTKRSGGFSLLELCIVIAVIAIVTALLVPLFGTIREQSRLTQCAAQLKQVGVAFHLYAADNRGSFPTMVYGNTHANKGQPMPCTWGFAAMPFTSRLLAPPYDITPQAKNTLKDARMLFCPAARRPNGTPLQLPAQPAVFGSGTIPYIGYSFIYIDTTVGYAANLYKDYNNLRPGLSSKNPPLLWCFTPQAFANAGTAHRSTSNVLKVDGSVRVLTHKEIDRQDASTPSDLGLRLLHNLTQ